MIARDTTLSSLYDARDKLAELIVQWAPDPCADPQARAAQADQLKRLILQRDQVNGAINAVIATAFQSVASPELVAASQELRGATDRLEQFGQTMDQLQGALKLVDEIVQVASKVMKLATALA